MKQRSFLKGFTRFLLVSILLLTASVNVNYQQAWATTHTASTGWVLANNGDLKQISITLPANAIGITSSRIRWKGYTGVMSESLTNTDSGTIANLSRPFSFPSVPAGGTFGGQGINFSSYGTTPSYSFSVGLYTIEGAQILGSGCSPDNYSIQWGHTIEGYPVLTDITYDIVLLSGGPATYSIGATTSFSISRNSVNASVNLNGGGSTICPISDLNSTTTTEWVPLSGLTVGTNNLLVNVTGTKKVYYEVEYTYITNEIPTITVSTGDNQGLYKGRSDDYAALLG